MCCSPNTNAFFFLTFAAAASFVSLFGVMVWSGVSALLAGAWNGEEQSVSSLIGWTFLGLSPLVFGMLVSGYKAAYGRYADAANTSLYGFFVPGKVAWILQESPCLLAAASLYFLFPKQECVGSLANNILLSLFVVHYIHRSVVRQCVSVCVCVCECVCLGTFLLLFLLPLLQSCLSPHSLTPLSHSLPAARTNKDAGVPPIHQGQANTLLGHDHGTGLLCLQRVRWRACFFWRARVYNACCALCSLGVANVPRLFVCCLLVFAPQISAMCMADAAACLR